MEDDLLSIDLEMIDPVKKIKFPWKLFGIIRKLTKLKPDDGRMLAQMSIKLKDVLNLYQNDKNKLKNVQLYEICIFVRSRKYATETGMVLQAQVNVLLGVNYLFYKKYFLFSENFKSIKCFSSC